MRFTTVILTAFFCLNAHAIPGDETASDPSDEALIEAAEKLVQEGTKHKDKKKKEVRTTASEKVTSEPAAEESGAEATTVSTDTVSTPTTEQKESEIPVQLTSPGKSKNHSNVMWRLAASFAALAGVAGILYYVTRRWTKPKDKDGKGARIEMVHQFHMGPRRSLALVRVAGEAILVGVTDHNINMIKPVTLIDDELEGLMKKDFNNFLEDEFSIEDVRTALRS